MKKRFFVLVLFLLAVIPFVKAATPGGADTSGYTDKGAYSGGTPGSIPIDAGKVYNADLDGTMSTYKWAGLYGNVTGTIILADSSDKQFYNWTGATGVLVYASTANSVSWSSLANATASDVTTAYSWLGSGTDSYSNTFTGSSKDIGSNIFSISSDYATPFPTSSGFETYSLKDGTNLVWAAKVLGTAATTYDGSTAQFEMLLPQDGTSGSPTTYYFWVELQ